MTMKVLFEKGSYRLLGAQIIGYDGVDKRIDVLATAMNAGMSALELKDLELAYAPPYSSAKDPVNMAGFMIDNIEKGTLKQVLPGMKWENFRMTTAWFFWMPGRRKNTSEAISTVLLTSVG